MKKMKGSRRQPLRPDPALPPQVTEEEGRRQGCARAVLRPSQFGEAAAGRAQGCRCRRWPRPPGETQRQQARGRQGPAPFVSRRDCRQCHLGRETRPPRMETRPCRGGAGSPASPPRSRLHLAFLLAVAEDTKPRFKRKTPHLTCVI